MDERLKQAILMAVLVFNIIIIVYQLAFNGFGQFTVLKLFIGLLIALAGAGIAFGVMKIVQK